VSTIQFNSILLSYGIWTIPRILYIFIVLKTLHKIIYIIENFKKNCLIYRDKRNILRQSDKEILTKKALIIEFEKLRIVTDESIAVFLKYGSF